MNEQNITAQRLTLWHFFYGGVGSWEQGNTSVPTTPINRTNRNPVQNDFACDATHAEHAGALRRTMLCACRRRRRRRVQHNVSKEILQS
jgi:hypothetical protein